MKYNTFDFSELNETFYNFDREGFLLTTPLNQRLSSNYINYNSITSTEQLIKIGIKYLNKFANNIFKFVTNENAPLIVFTFHSNSSYCEIINNKIVIDVKILLNEDVPYQVRIDTLQGIIFHELLHKRIAIADIAAFLKIRVADYYLQENNFLKEHFFNDVFGSNLRRIVWNILEDYRIEKLGVKDFPGYGFFLDVTRKYAFFHLSERNFNKPTFTTCALDYLMMAILFPEIKDKTEIELIKALDVDVAEKNKFINFLFDLKKVLSDNVHFIYSDNFSEIIHAVIAIAEVLEKYKPIENELQTIPSFSKGSSFMFNSDTLQSTKENIKEREKSSGKNLDDIIGIIIEESNAVEDENKKNELSCIVEKVGNCHITHPAKMIKEISIFNQPIQSIERNIYSAASKYSRNISANLGFLSSRLNKNNNCYELPEGEIDESELYKISYNNNIFFNEEKVKGYELDFGILIDESGSMFHNVSEAKIAALTLALALKNQPHINLYIYGHTADLDYYNNSSATVEMYKYYNSKENFININTIFNVESRANNADGYAIEKICEIMSRKSRATNKVLIVISDGQPNARCYSGNEGIEHTHDIVKKYESKGFYIIQICIDNMENSDKMFTNFIPYTNDSNFIMKLKNVLLKKLKQFHNEVR